VNKCGKQAYHASSSTCLINADDRFGAGKPLTAFRINLLKAG